MRYCPNCGTSVEKSSQFCQECGTKMEESGSNNHPIPNNQINAVTTVNTVNADSHHEKVKNYVLIGIGYLTVLILLGSLIFAWGSVKVINADRLILYPLLSVMLSIYVSLKLIDDKQTFIHGVIVALVSALIFLVALMA